MADQYFLKELERRYSNGCPRLEAEIRQVLEKLNDSSSTRNGSEQEEDSRNENEQGKFTCCYCGKVYHLRRSFNRHRLSHETTHKCEICQRYFPRIDKFKIHQKHCGKRSTTTTTTRPNRFSCHHCGSSFQDYASLYNHVTQNHPLNQMGQGDNENNSPSVNVHPSSSPAHESSAINGSVQKHNLFPEGAEKYDLLSFFGRVKPKVMEHLQTVSSQTRGIKYFLSVEVVMSREKMNGDVEEVTSHFRSNVHIFLPSAGLSEHDINECFQKMFQSFENYMRNGSGWVIKQINKLDIVCIRYSPLGGSSYIALPPTLSNSHSVINVKNKDQKCFVWSVLCGLHHEQYEQPELVENYRTSQNELDMTNIAFPVTISDIDKFEKQNPDIAVHVFGYEKEIFPLRLTKYHDRQYHINLLYITKGDTSHYCVIKDLNRFLSRTKGYRNNRRYWCVYCLSHFGSERLLDQHSIICSSNGPQKIIMPEEGENILKFKSFQKKFKVDWVIYADFECYNKKLQNPKPNPTHSSTTNETLHEPFCFAYKRVCTDQRYTKPIVVYQGSNAAATFLEYLQAEEREIEEIMQREEPIHMTPEDIDHFMNSTHCSICGGTFRPWDIRVRDHNHVSGKYRGCAHQFCNLQAEKAKFIPVVFHNLRSYDGHLLCQSVGKFKEEKINCIPNNMEKYISFSLGNLRFIDSLQFLNSSLETLTENLAKEGLSHFKHFQDEFPNPQHQKLLLRKGVFPYEYIDCEEKLDERQLPPREAFYSKLKEETVSQEDYQYACQVFETLGCETLLDFCHAYVICDVAFLSCIFERFRSVCMDYYSLDPCWYYTAPGLSWDAMLLKTGVEIELFTDIEHLLFAERGIRGGLSFINKKYAKANNCYLPNYDITKESKYIVYLDCNNLYSCGMSQKLPVGDYRFLDQEELDEFDVMSVPENGPMGYLIETSLHIPENLHDYFSDYPLAPEKRIINDEELSPHSKRLWQKLHPKRNPTDQDSTNRPNIPKLVATLYDKDNYVVHYRNLQLYIKLGMEVKAIHRVMEFRQENFMKPYIDFNTAKRKEAKNDFEKDFFKLLNCACFGKTMENLRKRRCIKLVQTERRLNKLTAKPSFKTCRIFNQDLVGVENMKTSLLMDKAILIGQTILDNSKIVMYDFYYNHLKAKYGDKITLVMTDTDSIVAEITTDNVYHDFLESLDQYYDTSNYPPNHFLYSDLNKKTIGKFKDELAGKPMSEFCGLRSKQYSFVVDQSETKKNKGISKTAIQKHLTHQMYLDALFNEESSKTSMSVIRSDDHVIYTQTMKKTALCSFDDKTFSISNTETLPFGHVRCRDYV